MEKIVKLLELLGFTFTFKAEDNYHYKSNTGVVAPRPDVAYRKISIGYEDYRTLLRITSSYTNCGLQYIDGFDDLLNIATDILEDKDLDKKLSSASRVELINLILRDVLIKTQNETAYKDKHLLFLHSSWKKYYGDNENDACIIHTVGKHLQTICESHYISPVNKNSEHYQIHGCFDTEKQEGIKVSNKLLIELQKVGYNVRQVYPNFKEVRI